MKKILILVLILTVCVQAAGIKRYTRPTFELGPKASLYIGNDAYFGIGAECIINPIKAVGIRLNLTEVIFGNGTQFYLNYGGLGFSGMTLDGIFYIPMAGAEPYVHGGFGVGIIDLPGPADSHSLFSFSFGMGLNYVINPTAKVFVEPGIIIYNFGNNTESMFRFSFGARFAIL